MYVHELASALMDTGLSMTTAIHAEIQPLSIVMYWETNLKNSKKNEPSKSLL